MQERFLQELELTKTISIEQARVERKKVTDAFKQLIREGLITNQQAPEYQPQTRDGTPVSQTRTASSTQNEPLAQPPGTKTTG
jgi:hypothetical protein